MSLQFSGPSCAPEFVFQPQTLEVTLHYIIAPTLARASHYAAGLGLTKDEWRAASNSSPRRMDGARADAFHLLPGISPELVATAKWCAAKTDAKIIDHRDV